MNVDQIIEALDKNGLLSSFHRQVSKIIEKREHERIIEQMSNVYDDVKCTRYETAEYNNNGYKAKIKFLANEDEIVIEITERYLGQESDGYIDIDLNGESVYHGKGIFWYMRDVELEDLGEYPQFDEYSEGDEVVKKCMKIVALYASELGF